MAPSRSRLSGVGGTSLSSALGAGQSLQSVAMIHPGHTFRKLTSGRVAQVSSVTRTHAMMYWPDNNTQTAVRKDRLETRTKEWKRI